MLEERFLTATSREGYRELGLSSLTMPSELEKTSGAGSDIVAKELVPLDEGVYAPEGTPQVLTYAFDRPGRYSYVASMMRGERIQRGRLREFNQLGVEDVGTRPLDPLQAVASIELMMEVLEGYDAKVSLGYLGCEADLEALRSVLLKVRPSCKDCCRRQEVNPIRMLDCKVCDRSYLPTFDTVGCDPCKEKRDAILALLGSEVSWDPYLVRGLDYYRGPVWEVVANELTVGGGGMYRAEVSRKNTTRVLNGVGWALGLERLLLQTLAPEPRMGPQAAAIMVKDVESLKQARAVSQGRTVLYGSLKECLRRADQLGCQDLLILGDRELDSGQAPLKDLATGEQVIISLEDLRRG